MSLVSSGQSNPRTQMSSKQTNIRLTDTERLALELAAEGVSRDGIAEKIGYSARTVDRTLQTVYRKLGVGTRGPALVRATQLGIIGGGR